MAVGDVYRLVRKITLDGVSHFNVLHFLQHTDIGADEEQALIDAWQGGGGALNPEAKLLACQRGYTSITLLGLECQKISPTEGDLVEAGLTETPMAALDSGLPTFSQFRVGILTDRPDRSGRGGFYVGGIAESQTTGNVVLSTFVSGAMQALLDNIVGVFSPGGTQASGFTIGVWSRLLSEFNAATTLTGETTLGTMRSRRVGNGI